MSIVEYTYQPLFRLMVFARITYFCNQLVHYTQSI
jgi:hypothetical protein